MNDWYRLFMIFVAINVWGLTAVIKLEEIRESLQSKKVSK